MIPLSVLDLSPIVQGGTPALAFRRTLELAQHAERLGYTRFWLAEHHNMPGIGSAATAVLIGHVGAGTSRIRLGAGGIKLPNHAPLQVAEQFGTLESLVPGPLDLGLRRAPGTDRSAMIALRRTLNADPDNFPRDVLEVMEFLADAQPDQPVQAVPRPQEGHSMVSLAVDAAAPASPVIARTASGGRPPRPLSELATEELVRPDDSEERFEIAGHHFKMAAAVEFQQTDELRGVGGDALGFHFLPDLRWKTGDTVLLVVGPDVDAVAGLNLFFETGSDRIPHHLNHRGFARSHGEGGIDDEEEMMLGGRRFFLRLGLFLLGKNAAEREAD
jgi:hypothetical protein